MANKIVAVRVQLRGDDVELTTLGESPRGTRVRLKSVQVPGVRKDKKEFHSKVLAALETLLPNRGTV